MFGQQFCGVNVIAYYSTNVFLEGGYSMSNALLVSMGTGILNWVFALPAFFTIDVSTDMPFFPARHAAVRPESFVSPETYPFNPPATLLKYLHIILEASANYIV